MAKKTTKKPGKTKPSSKKKTCKGLKTIGGIKSISFSEATEYTKGNLFNKFWELQMKELSIKDLKEIKGRTCSHSITFTIHSPSAPRRANNSTESCSSAPQQ